MREIPSDTMALVEFVDFGNAAVMPISKIGRLHASFLQLPMYSTHCMLSDAATLGKEEVLDPEVVSAFKKDISGIGEKVLKCHFIRQSGSIWEVSLKDHAMNVICKVPTRCSTDGYEIVSGNLEEGEEKPFQNSDNKQVLENSQKLSLNSCSLRYHQREFSEGQKLEVYITTTNDTLTFWCQSADSEDLDKVTSSVSEVGNAADHKHVNPGSLSPGMPCIALFSDDHFWYRAEVIDKDGDELSVLFVDYGNMSKVNVADVREMPTDLMETPAQAFLCELEGFNAAHGSWDSGAVDALSALTTDKASQLTITRVTKQEGKIKCSVQMECEGQVLNEALKTWWKSSTENETGAVGLTTSNETLLHCDLTEKETAPSEDQQEYFEFQEQYTAVACVHTLRDHSEEQRLDKLVDPQTANEVQKLESSSKQSKSSENLNSDSETFVQSTEEETDQIMSECNMTTGSQILKTTENERDTVCNEAVNLDQTTVSQTKPRGILPFDSGIDEAMSPPISNTCDGDIFILSCEKSVIETVKGTEEESPSIMDTFGRDDLKFPLDEKPTKAINESEFAITDLVTLPGELNTYSVESTSDILNVSGKQCIIFILLLGL